jgi:cyclopropane-fatty-acyl-phospholipid synthase
VIAAAAKLAERVPLPDLVTRAAIHALVDRTDRSLRGLDAEEAARLFAAAMHRRAIAEHADAANSQHYEVPTPFFAAVLGPHMKYSSCYFEDGDTLADAEARALSQTCQNAGVRDGQNILELGCGWGSLTLWMAERFPSSQITAVSNSASQRLHMEKTARDRRLSNVRVVTADINVFSPGTTFDRIVSVEMFEHVANWRALLERARTWLADDGRLFLHVFSHANAPYSFDTTNKADFIAQHFFTGGIMPSHGLIDAFSDVFAVEERWRWSGTHYARTAEAWLANYDARQPLIQPLLREVYGDEANVWHRRWRLFFLATAGLFAYRGGAPWGVSHYRLKRA